MTDKYGGHDPLVCAHGHAAWCLSLMGYVEEGTSRSNSALMISQDLNHVPSLIIARLFDLWTHVWTADTDAIVEAANITQSLCEQVGAKPYAAMAKLAQNWGRVMKAKDMDAAVEMRHNLAEYKATGSRLRLSFFLTVAAEAELRLGRWDEGLMLVDEAIKLAGQTNERCCESYSWRVRGDLFAQCGDGDLDAADQSLQKSIKVAADQGARLLELKAAISRAALYKELDTGGRAILDLQNLYRWFSEGQNTFVLREAQSLLGSA